jgi:dihydrofolate synthase/folylpolyglutamate synthase
MTYLQTLDYLYRKLPMFTRIGAAALKKDLHNTIELCGAIGNPQTQFKTIHIAGTNGKGSTSHMLAAILQKAGYKTGLYTSPHLKDFRERIRIDGKMISKKFVTTFVEGQQQLIERINPSFFEVTVAMAFDYFAAQKVDVAIIEVGLGGRLDSTNIIHPDLSVITNISLDHTNILGKNLKQIAQEKAGIIKPQVPVVIGEYQKSVQKVFKDKALACDSPIIFAEQQLHLENTAWHHDHLSVSVYQGKELLFKNIKLDLTGTYQLKNILTVIQAVRVLNTIGYSISETALKQAVKNVKKITGLLGRWQTLGTEPLIVCDTGHNKAGIEEVIKNIERTPYENLHMVIGMVKDKDSKSILNLLPKKAVYYFCAPDLERALSAEDLWKQAQACGLNGKYYETVADALNEAKKAAQCNDMIYVGGSTFVVSEVL